MAAYCRRCWCPLSVPAVLKKSKVDTFPAKMTPHMDCPQTQYWPPYLLEALTVGVVETAPL